MISLTPLARFATELLDRAAMRLVMCDSRADVLCFCSAFLVPVLCKLLPAMPAVGFHGGARSSSACKTRALALLAQINSRVSSLPALSGTDNGVNAGPGEGYPLGKLFSLYLSFFTRFLDPSIIAAYNCGKIGADNNTEIAPVAASQTYTDASFRKADFTLFQTCVFSFLELFMSKLTDRKERAAWLNNLLLLPYVCFRRCASDVAFRNVCIFI